MDAAPVCPICGKAVVPDALQGLCPQCLMKSGFDTRPQNQSADGNTLFIPPPAEQIARLFPQLEIVTLIGQGGMGAVYKARQPALGRLVALKILPPKSAEDPGFAERFNREARALARLNHPNIVAVYDFGQAGGMSYFLMEYVEGSTLRQVAQSGRLSPRETLGIITQICEALQFAHDEGVVHRDIKPENILLDQKGRIKIADFGIAKVLNQERQDIALTGAKEIIGTAYYMAPEQFEHPESVDQRADIFSLGVVFYELLTGELPLGKFAPPSQKAQADARLDKVVLHTLEREPNRRYQQARQLKADVAAIAAMPGNGKRSAPGTPSATRPFELWPKHKPKTWKTIWVVAGCGVAALAFFCLAAYLFGERFKPAVVREAPNFDRSNAVWALLNEDQRLVLQWTQGKFRQFDDRRNFCRWSDAERASLERRSLDTLGGPRDADFFQAINTLAALHSTNVVLRLRELAFERRPDKLLPGIGTSTSRFLATRALGSIGDKSAVPDLIHLLYRNNSVLRWCAQISLVQLTGQNFGSDWRAWGKWWNEQGSQPPLRPEMIRWWRSQPGPDELAAVFAKIDRHFIAGLKKRSPASQMSVEAEEPDDKTQGPIR